MTILTDEEISAICACDIALEPPFGYARAIEAAVIERIKSRGAAAYLYFESYNGECGFKHSNEHWTDDDSIPLYRIED